MNPYHWTPCHVDPVDFVCHGCALNTAPCARRHDDALRHAEAADWRRAVRLEPVPARSDLGTQAAEFLKAHGMAVPLPLLAEYLSATFVQTVDAHSLRGALLATESVVESSPGVFEYRAGAAASSIPTSEDTSSGAMISGLMAGSPPFPEDEQISLFKRLRALEMLGAYTTRAAALRELEHRSEAVVDRVLIDEGWRLTDVARYALGPARPPFAAGKSEENIARRRELLGCVGALDVLGNSEPNMFEAERTELHNALVARNLRLVSKIARRYARGGFLHWDDFMQVGSEGLILAVNRFDPYRGTLFSTYAVWWVRQAISRTYNDQERQIRLPVHVGETLARYRKLMANREGGIQTKSIDQVAAAMGESRADLMSLLSRVRNTERLVGARANTIQDDEEDNSVEASAVRTEIERSLASLHPREALVLRLRFGLADGEARTLELVGRELGVTRERVRQIEAKALRKLRTTGDARLRSLRTEQTAREARSRRTVLPDARVSFALPSHLNEREAGSEPERQPNGADLSARSGSLDLLRAAPESVLPGETVTFVWPEEPRVEHYALEVGSSMGGDDIAALSVAPVCAATVTGLPTDGRQIFVRLWRRASNSWAATDRIYFASSAGVALPAAGDLDMAGETAGVEHRLRGVSIQQPPADIAAHVLDSMKFG